ncbi:MAG TPA: DUF3999 family protein, partial [Woeseiaceae bacterium]|nr:DUF3999 family protein [Woeseiaceae bacterium]
QQRVFGGTAIGDLADAARPAAAAQLGQRFPLGGIERELPAQPLPWRTIVLWTGLVAAVMFVAWMAMRLLRDQ